MARKVKLDKIDFAILKILQGNGRITNLELSRDIELSPAPTLERVRKLEKAGFILSFHAKLNREELGIGLQALIQVSLVRQMENAMSEFVKQVNTIDEVVECHQVTGNFDYQLRVMVQDINALNELIGEKLSKIEEIGQFQSSIILSTMKEVTTLPIQYDR